MMSEFQKISGKITSVSSLSDKNGKDYWKIGVTVEGKQYPVNGTTWDNPTEYKANQVIELTMSEKEGTATNPKTGKPYTNRTFLLPNHVCKDGTLLSSKQRTMPTFNAPQNTNGLELRMNAMEQEIKRLKELVEQLNNKSKTVESIVSNSGLEGEFIPTENQPDESIPF